MPALYRSNVMYFAKPGDSQSRDHLGFEGYLPMNGKRKHQVRLEVATLSRCKSLIFARPHVMHFECADPPSSHRTGLRPRAAGNGNLLCRDACAMSGPSPSRDGFIDAQGSRKPLFPRNKRRNACEGLSHPTGWWAHQGSNLGPDD
jgi:hypothetical protein